MSAPTVYPRRRAPVPGGRPAARPGRARTRTPRSSTSASRTPVRTAPGGRWRSAAPTYPPTTWSSPGRCAARRTPTGARRRPQVAAAVAPWSEADAAKRIFDAARPLKKAGIPVLDALDHIAGEMRDIAAKPVVKGEMSSALTARLDEPYLRWCSPCQATHTYEQPFRLSALQAGLELEPGTSPPVLHRIPAGAGRRSGARAPRPGPGGAPPPRPGRRRSSSPGTSTARSREVKARWPEDVVPVEVDGQRARRARRGPRRAGRPAGGRTACGCSARSTCSSRAATASWSSPTPAARKDLWRTIGRPGGVLAGHEVVGSLATAQQGQEAPARR